MIIKLQARLDYIDENEKPISVYETKYGFFWINLTKSYTIIHSIEDKILNGIKKAITTATHSSLNSLVIPKKLKNNLSFLEQECLKSGKLYDPQKNSQNFRSISIFDDAPYEKGYENLEKRYPEVINARYRIIIDDEKETSLRIKCNKAAISLAGKIKASQFRVWCLDKLDELIRVIHSFKNDVPEYIEILDLRKIPELTQFKVKQREIVILIISKLLQIKNTKNSVESIPLKFPTPELVSQMAKLFYLQYQFKCPECNNEEKLFIKCPTCSDSTFICKEKNGQLSLRCHEGVRHQHLHFPIELTCENNHDQILEREYFLETVELLPLGNLLNVVSNVINNHVPGFSFDKEKETFYISGNNIIYHNKPLENKGNTVNINNPQTIIGKNFGDARAANIQEMN